ncbi:hypothetical protein [Undibacterium griseum]|uniref:hypothetical protein n=1 Tax=Undibacterium griseum TaxID=2762295 RepID=UPI001E3043EE|nr:hypothetical protein [Undibacterium griseum]
MATTFRCRLTLSVSPANPPLITEQLFDQQYKESTDSPIDEFLTRLQAINRLAPQPTNFDPFQGQLVLLGVIAAVESYFRTLFRRLIAFDSICQESVHERDVSYGAAIHLPKDMLPEAMLERISFVSSENITKAIREMLAIKGNLPPDLDTAIKDYARVCQLRHCAVHRFGKLGVSNAISLGLTGHKSLLEKPLKLDYVALQNTIAISTGLVKTLNNFLFNEMLSRLPAANWSTQYVRDKPLFLSYYKLFSDKVSTNRSAQPSQIYKQFLKQRALFAAGNRL